MCVLKEQRENCLLSQAEEFDEDGDSPGDAKRFLKDLLSDGPMWATDVFKDADQAGYSKRKMQRTSKAIGVQPVKEGMKGGWKWALPPKVPSISSIHEDAT